MTRAPSPGARRPVTGDDPEAESASDTHQGPPQQARARSTQPQRTTVASAWRHPAFRRLFYGSFASNIGTWMQNVTLIGLAAVLSKSAVFGGLIVFAQLGPILILSPVTGVVADLVDRKVIMIASATVQMLLSGGLAVLAWDGRPNPTALIAVVGAIGIANAFTAPAVNANLPALVGRDDLAAAVSINSAQMNSSRVLGPLLAGFVAQFSHVGWAFAINAATFLFVIVALATTEFDSRPPATPAEGPVLRLLTGLRAARSDRVITRVLVSIAMLSTCSLVFIYQMPRLAADNLGLTGPAFNYLFAAFGLGAAAGAISLGTLLSGLDLALVARWAMAAFAPLLASFTLIRSPGPAYPIAFCLGAAYFMIATAMASTLQERVPDEVRGRVMGLWMMAWAGLVPLGSLLAGPFIDRFGITPVLLFGAVVAGCLVGYLDLRPEEITPPRTAGQPGVPARPPATL